MENDIALSTWLLKSPKKQGTLKKSWKRVFCILRRASDHGVARIEYMDNETDTPKGIFILSECVSCQVIGQFKKYHGVFQLMFKDGSSVMLVATTDADMNLWCSTISEMVFGPPRKRLPTHSLPTPPADAGAKAAHVQENLNYHSVDIKEFEVTVSRTTEAEALGIVGTQKVTITSINITLLNSGPGGSNVVWPIRYLRRYGRDDAAFSFEAGRKCDTGPGVFRFKTDESNEIFILVDKAAKVLAASSDSSLQQRPATSSQPLVRTGPQQQSGRYHTLKREASTESAYRELGHSASMDEGAYGDLDDVPGNYSSLPASGGLAAAQPGSSPPDYDEVPDIIHGIVSGRPDRYAAAEPSFYQSQEFRDQGSVLYGEAEPSDRPNIYEENPFEREPTFDEHYNDRISVNQDTLKRRMKELSLSKNPSQSSLQ